MGIHYCLGASPSGAMKPPVSPNASWTVFRVQTRSELLLRAALLISFPTFFLSYGLRTSDGAVGQTVGPEE